MFSEPDRSNAHSIYDESFQINTLEQKPLDLSSFKGKKVLMVNVASHCGFTPQYQAMQKIYDQFRDNLVIIGFPCNQFGSQEPGEASQIATFCERNYGVAFPISEKIDVKGSNQHPIYEWLTQKSKNGVKSSGVKWNFQKYLLDEEGRLIDYFYSTTKPDSRKILKHIK